MAIIEGIKKVKPFITNENEDHQQVSYTTQSDTVIMDTDGLTLAESEVTIGYTEYKAKETAGTLNPKVKYIVPDYPSAVSYDTLLTFSNVSVPTTVFVEDTTYEKYGYKGVITLSNVTADYIPCVNFGMTEATSNNYSPIAECVEGKVVIYAKAIPTENFTIPSIICTKNV